MKGKWNVGWGVEERCNMDCAFCYSKQVRNSYSRLSLKDYIRFIDNNYMHIASINYGTGENSLSNEWFLLVKYIGDNYPFIKQALTTNGHISQACKNKQKKEIFEKYIDEVDISLDFAVAEQHNIFRGNQNAYDMAISSLEMCKFLNKKTTLVFLGTDEVVKTGNLAGLFEIAGRFGAYLRTNIYRPTQGINKKNETFVLSVERLIEMLCWVSKNHQIIKVCDQLLAPVIFGEEAADYSGVSSLRILGDGSITPSTYLVNKRYRKYNILDKGVCLKDIDFKDTIDTTRVPDKCAGCAFIDTCRGGVYDRRFLWYGTLDERDPYCPYRFANISFPKIKIERNLCFASIHDSYLPTLFFAC